MKLLINSLFLILGASFLFAQNLPWMQEAYQISNEPSYQDFVDAGHNYFSNIDINEKGSGYKQFLRWQSFARNYVKPDGQLLTNAEINNLSESFFLQRQANNTDLAQWETLGPFSYEDTQNRMSGQGRVNTIVISPHDANEYWIGTPGGGAWKSTDAGATWNPMTDNMPNLGVSAIAIDPVNPMIVYVGTGDDDGSTFSGQDGIYKSENGGSTWTKLTTGSNDNGFICDIYINPNDNTQIYAAGNSGFLKSVNGGLTWSNTQSGFGQNLKVKPGDWSTVYFNTRDTFYVSTNSGDTWTETTSGLPTTFIQRIMIDVSPDAPNNVYAIIADSGSLFHGIYISTDSGQSFSRQDNTMNNLLESSQAFFDLDIAVDPSDSNIIYTGCLNLWKSLDQGIDFSRVNEWDKDYQPTYTHADIHQIRFYNGVIFVASDGGIYRSNDNGLSFEDITPGIVNSEVYEINASPVDTDHIVAGLQDNGGYAYDGKVWRNWHWSDGTSNAIDPVNPNRMHGLFQTGAAYFRTEDSGQTTRDLFGNGSGVFETPIAVNSIGEVFVANIFLAKRVNESWSNLFLFPSLVYAMEIAPSNDDIIYANTGVELFRSDDGGANFTSVNNSITGFVEGISIHHTNPDIVYVITSNLNSGGIYRSIDGGQNFTNINSNLAGNLPLRVLELQPNHPDNPLYLGTDFGVYRYDDIGGTWEVFQSGMPGAIVRDLSIDIRGEELIAGTYGRGVWKTDLPQYVFSDDIILESISKPSSEVGVLPYTPEITLRNRGQNTVSNPIVNYTLNGSPNTSNISATLTTGQSIDVSTNTINIRGFYTLDSDVAVTSDDQLSNNSKEIRFILNDFGQIGEINSFENTSDALISINSSEVGSMWERGMPSGTLLNSAATGTMVYGTNLDGFHDSYTRSYLYTQFYDLTNVVNPELSFDMAYDIAAGHALYIQYSLDNGNSWELLGSASDSNWYNSSEEQWQSLSSAWQGGQWSGDTNATITNYTYDLSAWNGQSSFLMRFVFDTRFNSNPSTAKEGVIIDNLMVNGTTLSIDSPLNAIDLKIYPNPTSKKLNFISNSFDDYSVIIYDFYGKEIDRLRVDNNSYQLDTSSLVSGIYILKILIDDSVIHKKIIKN
ncbi:MAG: T9SS C-terminal target domain-containing protein [Winogradskyella sp.]|uniref:T9SS type A sorting domain-containing protein n=1 Tax=Winogradskyella sp. TaxID=1883156 RepID=UPI000F4142C5|nr:T9SS type A sorting domain-containing protein [Winogradskyella sp.]RNC85056.1 MAG: T9SS C-terminal target domain-containing protein [Winogradskyella sp.]